MANSQQHADMQLPPAPSAGISQTTIAPASTAPLQQPLAAASAAPSAVPLSSMSLDAYCHIHSLLTHGQATVQQLHGSQSHAVRAQDIKQVLFLHGHASGSRTKQEILEKMVGMQLVDLRYRHVEPPKQSAAEGAPVDADDLVALGCAAPGGGPTAARHCNPFHIPVSEVAMPRSKVGRQDPAEPAQEVHHAATGSAGNASPQSAAAAVHRKDLHSRHQPNAAAAASMSLPAPSDTARKRKASDRLSGQAAGKTTCTASHACDGGDDDAPASAACFPSGSVVWVTLGSKTWPALVIDAVTQQAAGTEPQAHVQLFATGIKTAVKHSRMQSFDSSDASTDHSMLGRKAFNTAVRHLRARSAEA